MAGLRHPNIVQLYDEGELDGRPYFTMEFVEGGSLAESLAGTPRPARQAAELLVTLAGAIDAAHRKGIVHRDLKPSNILLTADGTPKVGDFGLARHLGAGPALTLSGAAVGTPSYMAPEQARGHSREIGPAADVYALGAVLYELLTGRPPFRAETAAETVYQVITQDPAPPSRLNAKVPRDLETICLKCLQKEPILRYDGAAALAEDLRRFLRGEAIAARPEGRLARLARRIRHRPALSAAIAGGSLFTAILAGGGLWLILERAKTARKAEARQAANELAADEDLRDMVRWQGKSSWLAADAALERARSRLGDGGSAGLRRRLEQGARELELVARLDVIRLARSGSVGGNLAFKQSHEEYRRAFKEAGLGEVGDAPGVVASRVRASNIRTTLVAMLDDCALYLQDPFQKEWLLAVARLADDDPTGWRNRARDPETLKSKEAFAKLLEAAPVADQSVPFLLALIDHSTISEGERVPFLKRVQQSHPDDLWANLELGNFLHKSNKHEEAIRYYQAALAIRPGAGVAHNGLGLALLNSGRAEESLTPLRQAARIDHTAAQGHQNLAFALQNLGRYDEAIEQSRLAVHFGPGEASVHRTLGVSLEAKGRHDEAIAAYQQAVTIRPDFADARQRLRGLLIRLGRAEEARVAWGKALAAKPPGHGTWYGYAEFCLFLGQEDEYRRARRALLDAFGASTDPYLAERTGRACLLLPASEDELREIVALAEHAWGFDRTKDPGVYPHFLFVQGLAEYRRGRPDRAISLMQGEASGVLGPAPRLVLALALHQGGRVEEARKSFATAVLSHDWRSARVRDQDDWIYHSLRREAERTILPDLASFPAGTHQPRDNDERFALMGACQFANRPEVAAGLYVDAFDDAPQLAEDLRSGHRSKAARVAALAGRGEGGAAPGEAEQSRWRRQARQWLRADLAAWSKALDGEPAESRDLALRTLKEWRGEPDLSGLRDSAELEKLPVSERGECRSLWDDVNVALKRAEQAK